MSKILGAILIMGILSSFVLVGKAKTNENNINVVNNKIKITEESETEQAKTVVELKTKEVKYNEWFNSQFSAYDGSLIGINELIKTEMNDPDSFKHIKTSYVLFSKVPDAMTTFNKIALHYRLPEANLNDFLLYVDFSGKNKFNATIKQRALFICYYKNNDSRPEVSLIEIEEQI